MSISKTRNYNSGLVEVTVDFNEHGRLRLQEIYYKGDTTLEGNDGGAYFDIGEVIKHLEKIQRVVDNEGQSMENFKTKGKN